LEILQNNENAYLAFNAMVINKGYGTGVAQCNVSVKDPQGTEIYNMTSSNDLAIGEMGVDTIDVAYEEGTEFLLENPMLGTYTVEYTVYFDGKSSSYPHNTQGGNREILTKTLSFEVDNSVYARDANNPDDYIGPQYWDGGGTDGDILTVRYPFFENSLVTSVMVFIHPDSDAGSSLLCNIYQYDQGVGDYVVMASAPVRTIEAGDVGTWVTFTFPDPAYIYADEEYAMTPVLVGFEFYYSDPDNLLWLGCDKTVPSSAWGTLWYMQGGANPNQWYAITNFVGVPMIRINLFSETEVAENEIKSQLTIYPNPAVDIITLDHVADGRVEISDNLGRSLDVINPTGDFIDIDISNYKPGNYFVKFTGKEGNVSVQRFSIIR